MVSTNSNNTYQHRHSVVFEFLNSGVAAVSAILFTNPIDVVRTRLQLQSMTKTYSGIGSALWDIGKHEGIRGLQRGLSPACLLQFSNVSMRFGAYNAMKHVMNLSPDSKHSYLKSLMAAGCSGALAAVVSSPFFLLKNRFQAQGNEYPTLGYAFRHIYHTEGFIGGFYKGLSAFIPRVIVASAVQLSTYDVVKRNFMIHLHLQDGFQLHFVSSLVTGIAVVFAMQPFDFAATRVMSQPVDANGVGTLYKGPLDAIRKAIETEGPLSIYKGALASYLRFGPYCILVFVFLEQLRLLEAKLDVYDL